MPASSTLQLILLLLSAISQNLVVSAFSMSSNSRKEIYNIPGSGWKGKDWNWGYGNGTGHDCAMICRRRWGTKKDRQALINALSSPKPVAATESTIEDLDDMRDPPFEEVKLVLGLAWQNGRWNGSDGGVGGYGDVLATMADARMYETEDEEANSRLLVKDMMSRFHLICSDDAMDFMKDLEDACGKDTDLLRRKCAALVLSEMSFVENGL
mmetsp:Transcript_22754/g.33328  ORF Transcript_22754/g.33328 Transcript_22754/m.33328 type:complete len:211 (-) Transcript_22754:76-708(-)